MSRGRSPTREPGSPDRPDARKVGAGLGTIYTIGHSTRPLDEFVSLLRAHAIESLVDVRRYPGSRRYPQFNADSLATALRGAGIGYTHEVELGGRRAARPDSPNGAWRNAGFRGYADHMATPEFRAALDRLVHVADDGGVAVMCAEAVPWRCHRRLIADALVLRGVRVAHILSDSRADAHTLHEAARHVDGTIRYPAPADEQPELGPFAS